MHWTSFIKILISPAFILNNNCELFETFQILSICSIDVTVEANSAISSVLYWISIYSVYNLPYWFSSKIALTAISISKCARICKSISFSFVKALKLPTVTITHFLLNFASAHLRKNIDPKFIEVKTNSYPNFLMSPLIAKTKTFSFFLLINVNFFHSFSKENALFLAVIFNFNLPVVAWYIFESLMYGFL